MSQEILGHILIVDDDFINRTLLATSLEEHQHSVESAENGRQALELLGQHSFDVILLDLLMPELDGFEVLKHLKADPTLNHIPVIVISSLDEMDSIVRCIEMGALDYLSKPFDPILLQARIHAALVSKYLYDIQRQHLLEIQAEQQRADDLLLNILPAAIASRLKQGEKNIAENFTGVSVLFADIVDFTEYAALRTPSEVLDELNDIFAAFDLLTEAHGLEKIKTIGDSYMVAAGLPVPCPDHAERLAFLALDMLARFKELQQDRIESLHLRIGIHSGPVIAGVIGNKKIAYDLWGDTVNTASRMESHGVVDHIHISSDTFQLLPDTFHCEMQGTISVKGKGNMRTYLLFGKE